MGKEDFAGRNRGTGIADEGNAAAAAVADTVVDDDVVFPTV